jgi:hypothetical protein
MRTAVHAAPQILKWIGPLKNECDFFIHTWDINTYKNFPPGLSERLKFLGVEINWDDSKHHDFIDIPIDSKELDIITTLYDPKSLVVDDFFRVQTYWFGQWYDNYYQQYNLPNFPGEYWNPLYYSFFRSIELKRDYEKKQAFEYDMVLKLRLDTSYPLNSGYIPTAGQNGIVQYNESSLANEIKRFNSDRTKFYAEGVTPKGPSEGFWYGSSKVMDIAADYWHNKLGDESLNMTTYLAKYNIKPDVAANWTMAFHRIMATGCPADDWQLIYLLEA